MVARTLFWDNQYLPYKTRWEHWNHRHFVHQLRFYNIRSSAGELKNQVGYKNVTGISQRVEIGRSGYLTFKTWIWPDLSMLGVKLVSVGEALAIWGHQSTPSGEISTERGWIFVQRWARILMQIVLPPKITRFDVFWYWSDHPQCHASYFDVNLRRLFPSFVN